MGFIGDMFSGGPNMMDAVKAAKAMGSMADLKGIVNRYGQNDYLSGQGRETDGEARMREAMDLTNNNINMSGISGQQGRDQLAAAGQYMSNIMSGAQPTATEQLGQGQMQRAGQQIANQAARAGSMNAAGVRGAVNAMSDIAPQMAADIAGRAGMERLAAGEQAGRMGGQLGTFDMGRDMAVDEAWQRRLQNINGLENNIFNRRAQAQGAAQAPYMQGMGAGVGAQGNAANVYGTNMGAGMGLVGGGLSALGSMFSDKNLKEDIKGGDKDVKDFLKSISAKTYQYKKEVAGSDMAPKGKNLGVMAQDLEKSPIGKSAVFETEKGKAVSYGKLAPAMLASLASINSRLSKMEKKGG